MEGVENLEMQPRGTLRRRGRGMVGRPMWELGRASSARRDATAGAGAPISRETKGSSLRRGSRRGAYGTDDGDDSITSPEGRPPALSMRSGGGKSG